jgi:two-component system sensor histidine kinase ResE
MSAGYVLAVAATIATGAITKLLADGLPGFAFPSAPCLVVITLLALVWGVGPALISTVLGAILLDRITSQPHQGDAAHIAGFLAVLICGTVLSLVASQAIYSRRQIGDALRARDEALAAAKDLERQRDEFLAAISHDLKNPLTAILGMGQLLVHRAQRQSGLEVTVLIEGLETIVRTSRQMAEQINELLDGTRMRMGRALELDLQPTDLVALLRRLVDDYGRTSERHTVTLETALPECSCTCDEIRLERAVANLLANAIKYSPEGGPITVALACSEQDGRPWVTISVADRGVGIPEEELPRVVEPFYRASNVTGTFAGTGIGLAGVRHIAERHGGSISIASTQGVGTTVTLHLPCEHEAEPPLEASQD